MKSLKGKKRDSDVVAIQVMKAPEMREYLYRFYRKRITSFQANLYKANITGDMKDIHRSRLDVKKIFALFQLFEIINSEMFRKRNHRALFDGVYRRSGKIREIQVSLLLLSRFDEDEDALSPFRSFLSEREKKQTEKLLLAFRRFREKELKKTDRVMEQICEAVSPSKLLARSNQFLAQKAKKIAKFLTVTEQPENIHNIRKELKAMSTISTLIIAMRKDDSMDPLISALNKTEMLIGNWHDNRVLIDFFIRYRTSLPETPEPLSGLLNSIELSLIEENQTILEKLLPEVRELVKEILPPEKRKKSL